MDHLVIKDVTGACGCGQKMFLIVISPDFDGMGLLDRQRKVLDILKEEVAGLHSIELKTWTPV